MYDNVAYVEKLQELSFLEQMGQFILFKLFTF